MNIAKNAFKGYEDFGFSVECLDGGYLRITHRPTGWQLRPSGPRLAPQEGQMIGHTFFNDAFPDQDVEVRGQTFQARFTPSDYAVPGLEADICRIHELSGRAYSSWTSELLEILVRMITIETNFVAWLAGSEVPPCIIRIEPDSWLKDQHLILVHSVEPFVKLP